MNKIGEKVKIVKIVKNRFKSRKNRKNRFKLFLKIEIVKMPTLVYSVGRFKSTIFIGDLNRDLNRFKSI